MEFGVYTHSTPDGRIFYVGKGTESRSRKLSRKKSSVSHWAIVRKHSPENIIVTWHPSASEKQALEEEIALIAKLRADGQPLVNISNGGDGTSGNKHSQETIEHLKKRAKERWGNSVIRETVISCIRRYWSNPTAKSQASVRNKIASNTVEEIERRSVRSRGRMWVTNKIAERFVEQHVADNLINSGWIRGRK